MVISTKTKMTYLGSLLMLANAAASQAMLVNNGDGTITDTEAGLMWLSDLNFTNTTGFDDAKYGMDTNGALTWDDAMLWASDLTFAGYDDWRLPTATYECVPNATYGYDPYNPGYNPDCKYVVGGEFTNLYYNALGNTWGDTTVNLGPFTNVSTWAQYWTSLELGPDYAVDFHLLDYDYLNSQLIGAGYGHPYVKNSFTNVIAVRSISANVPEPAAWSLIAIGLIGTFAARRKQRAAA